MTALLLSYLQGRKGVPRRDRRRYVTKSPSPNPIALRHTRMQDEESHSHHNGNDSAKELRSVSHESSPESGFQRRKRPLGDGSMFQKRHKRPSVEAHTLSVTRLSVPVCEPSGEPAAAAGLVQAQDCVSQPQAFAESGPLQPPETLVPGWEATDAGQSRPRSLRVSLSLSEDMEVGSPLVKMQPTAGALVPKAVRSPGMDSSSSSSEAHSLPSWDDIATSDPAKGSAVSTAPSSKAYVVHISDTERNTGSCSTLTEACTAVPTERKRKLTDSDTRATAKIPRKEMPPQSTASYSPSSSSSDEVFDSSSSENKFAQRQTVDTSAASLTPLKPASQSPSSDLGGNLSDGNKATQDSVVTIRDASEPAMVKNSSVLQSVTPDMKATPLPKYTTAASSPIEVATKSHSLSAEAVNVSLDLSERPQKMQRPTSLKPQASLNGLHGRASSATTMKVTARVESPQPQPGRIPIIQHTKQVAAAMTATTALSPTAVAVKGNNQQSTSGVAPAKDFAVTLAAAANSSPSTSAGAVAPKLMVVSTPASIALSSSTAPMDDTDDVIMTGFEPQKHPAKAASHRALSASQTSPSGHLPKDTGVKKVLAKTVVSIFMYKLLSNTHSKHS